MTSNRPRFWLCTLLHTLYFSFHFFFSCFFFLVFLLFFSFLKRVLCGEMVFYEIFCTKIPSKTNVNQKKWKKKKKKKLLATDNRRTVVFSLTFSRHEFLLFNTLISYSLSYVNIPAIEITITTMPIICATNPRDTFVVVVVVAAVLLCMCVCRSFTLCCFCVFFVFNFHSTSVFVHSSVGYRMRYNFIIILFDIFVVLSFRFHSAPYAFVFWWVTFISKVSVQRK